MVNRNIIEEVINKSIVSMTKCPSLNKFMREFNNNRDNYLVENVSLEPIKITDTLSITDEDEIMNIRGIVRDPKNSSILYGDVEMHQDRVQKKVKYTQAEFSGVNNYATNDYKLINGKLYNTNKWKEQKDRFSNFVNEKIEQIDSAIENTPPLIHDAVLFRYGEFPLDIEVGDVGKWKGYTSTTLQEKTAERFKKGYDNDSENRYKIKIYASEGTKGVLVNDTFETLKEHEWLLPRNTRYKVLSVNHETMEAEVVIVPEGYY